MLALAVQIEKKRDSIEGESMVWHVVGQESDFNTDPNIHLLNLLRNRWSVNGADNDPDLKVMNTHGHGVRFATDWFNARVWYQIIVKPLSRNMSKVTLGSKGYFECRSHHIIHIFAKGRSARDKIWKLEKEVERIIAESMVDMQDSIQLVLLEDFRRLPVEDPAGDVEHSIANVVLRYYKVST
ncbi:MAG: hypothetical protein QXL23_03315 [Candidatus Nitrosocaldus sp.]